MIRPLNAGEVKMAALMTEGALEASIKSKCKSLGVLYYHTYRSTRSPSGFPDDVIVGPRGVLYRENKREKGKVSDAQQEWLDGLQAAGQDVGVWRPSDLFSGRIDEEILAVSGRRKKG